MCAVARDYKDRLFRAVFRNKKELLSLYNAINDSNYADPEALQITTLEDVVYMGMKNDVSFILGDVLNLWEHQSSYNPNMPIRGLFYLSRMYRNYIEANGINIYSSHLKTLPIPRYIVFYNGLKEEEDRRELRLSEAFIREDGKHLQSCLEVKAIMLNINQGRNRELMDKCQRLREYAAFVNAVREELSRGRTPREAIEMAITYCLKNRMLEDILSMNKREVIDMFLTEYDTQRHMEMEREENFEAGRIEGERIGREQGIALSICQILEQKFPLSDELYQRIHAETDLDVLTGWIAIACASASAEEFQKQAGLNLF